MTKPQFRVGTILVCSNRKFLLKSNITAETFLVVEITSGQYKILEGNKIEHWDWDIAEKDLKELK